MEFAKERRSSENLVRASKAYPGRYYICPTCFADVFLRRGRWRVPHFAHRSGLGKADCENFHPSDELTYSWLGHGSSPGSANHHKPVEPLALSIELQPESTMRGRKLRAWELRLTVPKSEDGRGQITLDCGAGVRRTLSLSKLTLNAQAINVDVDAEDFAASWTSPEVLPEYKAVVQDRIPGLDREQPTLFASSNSRLKPRVDRVSWGAAYYIVWHETFEIGLPRNIALRSLEATKHWRCGLIVLPDDQDAEVKVWIEEIAAVAVSSQRRIFGVVYPPPCGLDILGRVILPASPPAILGLRQTEANPNSSVKLHASVGNAEADSVFEGSGRHLVQIATDSNRAQIAFQLDETTLPLLLPTPAPTADILPQVRFVAGDFASPGRSEVALGTKEAVTLFDKVRRGQAELFKLTTPAGVKGMLSWRKASEISWSSISLGGDSDKAQLVANPEQLTQLNKVIRDRGSEIEFDFGGFGFFRAYPDHPRNNTATLLIPRSTRDRIRWLAAASGSFVDANGVVFDRLPDMEVAAFVRRLAIPSFLAAHHRAVMKEIDLISGRSARPC